LERIQTLRKRIDEIDERILHFLKERMELCEAIGTTKREHGIPVRDQTREKELYKRFSEKATKLGLNPQRVEAVYREIIAMCTHAQERQG